MGTGASMPSNVPDKLDEATCRELVGDKFDESKFAASKDTDGNITREQFSAMWQQQQQQQDQEGATEPTAAETKASEVGAAAVITEADRITFPEPDTTQVNAEVQKKFHSMCRWNKPAGEIQDFITQNPGCQNSVDPGNGNLPLHIATQNGHIQLVDQLLHVGVLVDAQNGTGQTALHMAKAYDYHWCAIKLYGAGASRSVKNNDGHEAWNGIDGDKNDDDFLPALTSAHNKEELEKALKGLQGMDASTIDKGALVMAKMQKKKSCKEFWDADFDARFTAFIKSV